MFAYDNRVQLSEFSHFGKPLREVAFFGVGKLASRVPSRLVPAVDGRALKATADQDGIVAVATTAELAGSVPDALGVLVADDPVAACFHIHRELGLRPGHYWQDFPTEIAPSATVHPSARIGERSVRIGEDALIEAGAVICERSLIGARTRIGPGTVIGTSAFELAEIDGQNRLLTQSGGVRVGADSIFLSAAMVARSCFATFTEIEDNCAVDNLVHIAHDCHLGRGSQVTACALLAGRVTVGENGYVGPNATISNGITIGAGAQVTLGAVVIRDVPPGEKVTGNFAVEHRGFMRRFREQMKNG